MNVRPQRVLHALSVVLKHDGHGGLFSLIYELPGEGMGLAHLCAPIYASYTPGAPQIVIGSKKRVRQGIENETGEKWGTKTEKDKGRKG